MDSKQTKIAALSRKVRLAQKEKEAFVLLSKTDLDLDNIFYSEVSDSFTFGWLVSFSEEDQIKIKNLLYKIGFSRKYKFEFK